MKTKTKTKKNVSEKAGEPVSEKDGMPLCDPEKVTLAPGALLADQQPERLEPLFRQVAQEACRPMPQFNRSNLELSTEFQEHVRAHGVVVPILVRPLNGVK